MENHGNRAAARTFDMNEANVCLWKRNKETLCSWNCDYRADGRGKQATHPQLVHELLEYIQ